MVTGASNTESGSHIDNNATRQSVNHDTFVLPISKKTLPTEGAYSANCNQPKQTVSVGLNSSKTSSSGSEPIQKGSVSTSSPSVHWSLDEMREPIREKEKETSVEIIRKLSSPSKTDDSKSGFDLVKLNNDMRNINISIEKQRYQAIRKDNERNRRADQADKDRLACEQRGAAVPASNNKGGQKNKFSGNNRNRINDSNSENSNSNQSNYRPKFNKQQQQQQKIHNNQNGRNRIAKHEGGFERGTELSQESQDFGSKPTGLESVDKKKLDDEIWNGQKNVDSYLESTRSNSLHLNKQMTSSLTSKYVAPGFQTNELKEMKHFSPPWFYEVELYSITDQRLDRNVFTKSDCDIGVRGKFYEKSSRHFVKHRYVNKYLHITYVSQLADFTKWLMFYIMLVLVGSFGYLVYKNQLSYDFFVTYCLVFLIPSMIIYLVLSKNKKYYHLPSKNVSINLAHLINGYRLRVQTNPSLAETKLSCTDQYITDLPCQTVPPECLRRFISCLAGSNIFQSLLPKEFGKITERSIKEIETATLRLKPKDALAVKQNKTRAWTFDYSSLITSAKLNLPAINLASLLGLTCKRTIITPKEDCPHFSQLMEQALRNIGVQPLVNHKPDINAFALDFCERKALPSKERLRVLNRARELDSLQNDWVNILFDALKKTSAFIKNEAYDKEACDLRMIVNPDLDVKLIFGCCIRGIEKAIYNNSKFSKFLIKGKNSDETMEILLQRFKEKTFGYLESDYKNFEATQGKVQLNMEYDFYCSLTDNELVKAIINVVREFNLQEHDMDIGRVAKIHIPVMRYSGFPTTACGNVLLNYAFLRAVEQTTNCKILDMLIEGDDSLIKFDTVSEAETFKQGMLDHRFIAHETAVSNNAFDLSFCGFHMDDDEEFTPNDKQINMLGLIFFAGDVPPSPQKVLSVCISKLLCFSFHFGSSVDGMVEKLFVDLISHPYVRQANIHTSKIYAELRKDWFKLQMSGVDLEGDAIRRKLKDLACLVSQSPL